MWTVRKIIQTSSSQPASGQFHVKLGSASDPPWFCNCPKVGALAEKCGFGFANLHVTWHVLCIFQQMLELIVYIIYYLRFLSSFVRMWPHLLWQHHPRWHKLKDGMRTTMSCIQTKRCCGCTCKARQVRFVATQVPIPFALTISAGFTVGHVQRICFHEAWVQNCAKINHWAQV